MALWTGLGQAATVAQLVGADVGGLISMIVQAAMTARQNRSECEQLARRVLMIAQLLPHVQEPEAAQPLAGLGDTLRDTHELVVSCQGRSAAYQFVMASRTAEKFREVQSKIDSYLILFPVISHIGITRRLERIYNVLVQDGPTGVEPSPLTQQRQQVCTTIRTDRADDAEIGVYFGKEKNLLPTLQKKKKGLLTITRQIIEPEELEGQSVKTEELEGLIIVYEYMENGTLFNHLHPDRVGSSALSPVMMSWKMRVDVLLGVSCAMEHLHCHANPPIIHRDIKSANILFDASWVPRMSDFGSSIVWDTASEEQATMELPVIGTFGYLAPEYSYYGHLKPANDVYSLGVVMLEVLTGKHAFSQGEQEMNADVASFAVPIIEAANIVELLDRWPVPEPTPWQLQALKRVAHIARCCVKFAWKDRPAISAIVANLKMVHTLVSGDEPGLVDESILWPFLANDESGSVNKLQDLPRASSVSSAGYQSDLESEVLEEGR